jgi:hypothetical protein
MSSPATGSFYSVLTFLVLAGAFVFGTRAAFGWDFPSQERGQTIAMSVWFLAAAGYSMLVGRHRDVEYLEALRRGAIDVGRTIKGVVMR